MLKATANDGNVSITAAGNLTDLLADTLQIINGVYNSLFKYRNEEFAQTYKKVLVEYLVDSENGIWDLDDTDNAESHSIQQDGEPTATIGVLDLDGCESGEDAAKAMVSLLRSMGVPVPKDDTEEES